MIDGGENGGKLVLGLGMAAILAVVLGSMMVLTAMAVFALLSGNFMAVALAMGWIAITGEFASGASFDFDVFLNVISLVWAAISLIPGLAAGVGAVGLVLALVAFGYWIYGRFIASADLPTRAEGVA